jgi:hypothetical protein
VYWHFFDKIEITRECTWGGDYTQRPAKNLGGGCVFYGDAHVALRRIVLPILPEDGGEIVRHQLDTVLPQNPSVDLKVGFAPFISLIRETTTDGGGNITIIFVGSCDAMSHAFPDFIVLVAMLAGFDGFRHSGFPIGRGHDGRYSWGGTSSTI